MTQILISIYFIINSFFAGHYLASEIRWCNENKERYWCIVFTVASFFLYIPYFVLKMVLIGVGYLFKLLDEFFQITFFFGFYFTKEWDNLKEHQLLRINRISHQKPTKTIKGRIYKYGTSLINKRNNYKYIHDSEPNF